MPRSLLRLLALSDSGDLTALTESDLSTAGMLRLGGFLSADVAISGSLTSYDGLRITLNSVKSRDWLTADETWLEQILASSEIILE